MNMSSVATVRPEYMTTASDNTLRPHPTHTFCNLRIANVSSATKMSCPPTQTKYTIRHANMISAKIAGSAIMLRHRFVKSTFCVHSNAKISGLSWNRNAHLSNPRMFGSSSQCKK